MIAEANESILLEPCTPPVVRATQASGSPQAPAAHMPGVRAATNVMWWVGEELRPLPVAETKVQPSGTRASLWAILTRPAARGLALPSTVSGRHFETLAALPLAARVERSMKPAFDRSRAGAHGCVRFGKSISKLRAIRHQLAMMPQRAAGPHAAQAAFARGKALPTSVDLAHTMFAGVTA